MKGMKLLIVDDEAEQRQLLSGFLTRRGYEIAAAASGEEALEKYPTLFSPVALIDMKMPGMDGIDAARPASRDESVSSR
jgi:CheY-like chemotaxis protein